MKIMQYVWKILLIIIEILVSAGGLWAVLQFRMSEFKKLDKEQAIVLLVIVAVIVIYYNVT